MDHWTENYCEEENNLLAYNRFMLDRLQQQQRQEGQRTHTNLANVIQSPSQNPSLRLILLLQGRNSTKLVGGANVSKKCRPPWLVDGKNFKF